MTNKPSARIEPLLPPEWNDAVMDAASAFPSGRDFILNNWETGQARGMNGVGTMLRHPALAKAFLTFNNHVAINSTLSKRIRELLILRVSWLRQAEYEYQQHVILGKRAGLTDIEIRRIQSGPDAEGWDEIDAGLLRAVDQLIAKADIDRTTWDQLAKHFNEQQLLDIIFVVGCYEVLAMVFNACEVPFESSLEPLSAEDKQRMYAPR